MPDYESKLKKKLEQVRTDLKYYKQMSPEEYINERVINKIKIYFLFGQRNKRWYNLIAILSITAGVLVPVVLNFNIKYAKEYATALTLLAGGLISLEAAVFNFKEKYKSYKKTEDQLTNELMLFQTSTEPYNAIVSAGNPEAIYQLFVSRVESTILKERDDTIEKVTRMSLDQIKTGKP
jgi:hypothetical protein